MLRPFTVFVVNLEVESYLLLLFSLVTQLQRAMISVSLNRTKNWCEVKSNYNVYFFKSFVRFQLNSVIRNGRLPSKNSPKVFDFHPEFWYIDKQPKLDEGQQPQQQQQQQQSFLSFSQ